MKFVHLPLYDENGMLLKEYVKIDHKFFITGPAVKGFKGHVVSLPNPEDEIELIDRIISDLPTDTASNWAGEWKTIPGFSGYKMNRVKTIIDSLNGEKMVDQIIEGKRVSVVLLDDKAIIRRMSVDHLLTRTFGES